MSEPGMPLHTYMIQRHRMHVASPLTFLFGERIVAVVSFEPVPGLPMQLDVTVLVELPITDSTSADSP